MQTVGGVARIKRVINESAQGFPSEPPSNLPSMIPVQCGVQAKVQPFSPSLPPCARIPINHEWTADATAARLSRAGVGGDPSVFIRTPSSFVPCPPLVRQKSVYDAGERGLTEDCWTLFRYIKREGKGRSRGDRGEGVVN